MSRKRVALNDSQSADLCDAVYGDALLPLPRALQVLRCSCEHTHNDGVSLHIRRCTNLITFQDNQIGHTLCTLCRSLEDDVPRRGVQIMVRARVRWIRAADRFFWGGDRYRRFIVDLGSISPAPRSMKYRRYIVDISSIYRQYISSIY